MTEAKTEFEELSQEASMSLVREFFLFIKENKAWWMVPIIIVLGLIGGLAWFAGTGVAPFVYPV